MQRGSLWSFPRNSKGSSRAEKRSVLVARLGRSGTSLAEAEDTLDQLKAQQPEEDPKSAACVKIWDSGIATVKATSGEAEEISRLLESEVALGVDAAPPKISPELEKQISSMSVTITRFLATNPPVALVSAVRQACNRLRCGSRFPEA